MHVHGRVRQALVLIFFTYSHGSHGLVWKWECAKKTTTSIRENGDFGFPFQAFSIIMIITFLAKNRLCFYPRKGLLIMKRKPIAMNYVHTWVAFDVTVVLIDWAPWLLDDHLPTGRGVGSVLSLRHNDMMIVQVGI